MPLDDRRLAMLREMGVPFWQPLPRAGTQVQGVGADGLGNYYRNRTANGGSNGVTGPQRVARHGRGRVDRAGQMVDR